ncbi:hypothetical protein TELCIR_19688, partial [Teladorsagia circumcincta]
MMTSVGAWGTEKWRFQGHSDLEQISRIFSVLGTPSEQTWPSWNTMPDATKLIFDNMAPLEDMRSV